MTSASPLAMYIMPKRDDEGRNLHLGDDEPLSKPASAPVRDAAEHADRSPASPVGDEDAGHDRRKRHHRANRQVDAAVMMTKVTPSANTPLTAVASRMPTMLLNCKKLGDASEKTMNRTISARERQQALGRIRAKNDPVVQTVLGLRLCLISIFHSKLSRRRCATIVSRAAWRIA